MSPGDLPPLTTHAEAKLWLERIGRAVATDQLTDRAAQEAIRAVSEWVKAHEGDLTARMVGDLQGEVNRLEQPLARETAAPPGVIRINGEALKWSLCR